MRRRYGPRRPTPTPLCCTRNADPCHLQNEEPYLLVQCSPVLSRVHVWCPSPRNLPYVYLYAQLFSLTNSAEVPEEPLPGAVVKTLVLRRNYYAEQIEGLNEQIKETCAKRARTGDDIDDGEEEEAWWETRKTAKRRLIECTQALEETAAHRFKYHNEKEKTFILPCSERHARTHTPSRTPKQSLHLCRMVRPGT